MRILIIHNEYQHIGGEDFVVKQEIEALLQKHEVELFTVKNVKGLAGYLQYLSYPLNWKEANRLETRIKHFRPDIIHIHNMHYALGPLFILHIKKLGIPMVMTLHNFRLLCPSATLFHDGNLFLDSITQKFPWQAVRKKALENSYIKTFWTAFTYWIHRKRGTFKKVDRFIALSEFAKNLFHRSTFEVPIKNFLVKPNFVKEVAPTEVIQSQAFVYVGRLSEEKGILPLLHAWTASNHELKIFGTGPLQEEVEKIANSHPNIHYYGFQDKQMISNHMAGASAVIVPSVCYESMPLAVLEAYALGVPVLASNIGILNEMVVPLYTGMLFDPHNHPQIIQTLAEWQAIPADKKEIMKANCRETFLKHYEQTLVMNQLEHIYQEVIKEQRTKI